jgi:hypothetical protein
VALPGVHVAHQVGELRRRDWWVWPPRIAAEAAPDGIYVLRTSVSAESFPAPEVVSAYKRLARHQGLVHLAATSPSAAPRRPEIGPSRVG